MVSECKAGYYGGNCTNSCGHCLNEKACHHVHGMCSEECEPGYKAPYCTEGDDHCTNKTNKWTLKFDKHFTNYGT